MNHPPATTTIASCPPGFRIFLKRYGPGHELQLHTHPEASLCLALSGGHRETDACSEGEYGGQDLIFKPAGERHFNKFGCKGALMLYVEIMPGRLQSLLEAGLLVSRTLRIRSPHAVALGQRLYHELSARDPWALLAQEGLLLELAAELGQRPQRMENETGLSEGLASVRDCLHEEFAERITHERLASLAGVHPAHLARRFRGAFGTSIGRYLRRVRVDRAITALVETDQPLSEIALQCGFYDQSHFNRVFKRATGYAPNRYRRLFSQKAMRG